MYYLQLLTINADLNIKLNEPLAPYTYTKVGGAADALIFPKTLEEVKQVVDWVKEKQVPLTVLGNASNLIVRDGGLRGVVMMLTDLRDITIDQETVTALAGDSLIETTQLAKKAHLTGLEFACGIPGSIGGAVYMNAGAYGGEVKDVIHTVDVLTREGEFKTYTNEEMAFTYRNSFIQQTGDIVLSTTFILEKGDYDAINERMVELTELRTSRQPLEYPSCGSVFKRPEGHFVGPMIREAGLQGFQIGGAQVSMKHAGFIVNKGGATATDYIQLIRHIQEVIDEKFQIKLEPEVRIIGEEG
ncbi:UDP-N-acetylmuramate dehydrogenase [Dolosicoccus paucivorans]|uniref:UDP-N-acetylmuramate dehydrogenase n=1 Tax=Dolosicoccus paucivorans TaxID=84521 RepID=UPI0008803A15|nr:UDP-N-acetylmuramate dehydrogenase [Dolosicoccus paucivorans]SDI19566.1 UDP-N-acetylmuramate dehydrogenase [Dolosicoccus paucivorans]